jgi:RNA polymerase sigma-70 factor, ECF subfamily
MGHMNAICARPALTELPDDVLLARCLRRDQLAFAELLRRYRGILFRCVTRITARYERVLGSEDVDEIFAEICLTLWADDLRRLRAFDPGRGMKLGSWLGLIASHATYDFLRRVARRPMTDEPAAAPEAPSDDPSALDHLLCDERRARLGDLVGELSARDRDFYACYFGDEQEPEEVARALRISVKTVYSKKNKITTRLLRRAAEARLAA